MHLDERIPKELREQFASQTEHLHDLTLETIKPMFRGIETDDFNEGLLAGLTAAYQVLKLVPQEEYVSTIGAMIAVVSREIYKKSKEQSLSFFSLTHLGREGFGCLQITAESPLSVL